MSWKKTNWVNDEVLTHEQKHFDIVELYARKLRKAVFETRYTDYNDLLAKLEILYDKNDKEMDKYQDLYDEESDGSMNGEKQREWNKRIIQELDNYRKFKDAVVTVYINQN
jgi:predicted secreted Zn-dependent protease